MSVNDPKHYRFKGQRYTVVGLGRSGRAAARFLLDRGARVHCTDQRSEPELGDTAETLRQAGATVETGGHDRVQCLASDGLVLSPGVPTSIPLIREAFKLGVEVISEVELAYRTTSRQIIGITGSNGKSTVTSLIGHVLQESGLPTLVGGNLGTPLVELISGEQDSTAAKGWLVAELSSFQLESIIDFRPRVAVMLNVTEDHMDRYRDLRAYAAAKERIFLNQKEGDAALFNLGDQVARSMAASAVQEGVRRLFYTSGRGKPREDAEGAYMSEGWLTVRLEGRDFPMMTAEAIPLEGRHNLENSLAAATVAGLLDISPEKFSSAVASFRPLPHRMEPAGTVRGIRAINDSKATNVDSVLMALNGMKKGSVLLIMGGLGKGGDFSRLRGPVAAAARHLLLIGADAAKIAEAMDPDLPVTRCDSLERAVELGIDMGSEGDVLLLSPGCASFDMFDDFEHRGRVFMEAVNRAIRSEEN